MNKWVNQFHFISEGRETTIFFNIYNINQITLGEHAHKRYCWHAILNQLVCNSMPTHLEWGSSSGKHQKIDYQLLLWAGSSPNSSGTGPARLEKHQLLWKRVKEINETVKKRISSLFIHKNIAPQLLNQCVCNRPTHLERVQLVWKMWKKIYWQLLVWAGASPNSSVTGQCSSGKAPVLLGKSKREDEWKILILSFIFVAILNFLRFFLLWYFWVLCLDQRLHLTLSFSQLHK